MTDLTRRANEVGDDTPFGQYIRPYLGQQVKVTLDRTDPAAVVTGQLIHATDDGQVTVVAEDGTVHYAWPGLRIDIIDKPEATP